MGMPLARHGRSLGSKAFGSLGIQGVEASSKHGHRGSGRGAMLSIVQATLDSSLMGNTLWLLNAPELVLLPITTVPAQCILMAILHISF